jgi:hypothetical protein
MVNNMDMDDSKDVPYQWQIRGQVARESSKKWLKWANQERWEHHQDYQYEETMITH